MNALKILKYGSMRIGSGAAWLSGWAFEVLGDVELTHNGNLLGYSPDVWVTTQTLEAFDFQSDGTPVQMVEIYRCFISLNVDAQPILKISGRGNALLDCDITGRYIHTLSGGANPLIHITGSGHRIHGCNFESV